MSLWACSTVVEDFVKTPSAESQSPDRRSESGDRIKVHTEHYYGEDGSKVFHKESLYDSALGDYCTVKLAEDGKYRCLPRATSTSIHVSYYLDENCTILGANVDYNDCSSAYRQIFLVTAYDEAICMSNWAYSVHLKEGEEEVQAYELGNNGECVPRNDYTVLKLGPKVDITTFAEMTLTNSYR